MEKASVASKVAAEPVEEACQPLIDNSQRTIITAYNNDLLSQPPRGISHRQKLAWLQQRRREGLWVQCDDCNSWRYLPHVLDNHELPKKWYCRLNPDSALADCSATEVPIQFHDEEDLIHSEYAAGSLVVVRMPGWPWWPAMVDDCPDTEQYYWLDGFSDIPTHYNVVFFDAIDVTRAWIAPSNIRPYDSSKKLIKRSLKIQNYQKRMEVAISQADDAEKLPLTARLAKYSFIARYKGKICTPKKLKKADVMKHQEKFKRKFNIDLSDDMSDSDDDNVTEPGVAKNVVVSNRQPRKRKIIESDNSIKHSNEKNAICSKEKNSSDESLAVQLDDCNSELIKISSTYETTGNENMDHNDNQRSSTPPSEDFDF